MAGSRATARVAFALAVLMVACDPAQPTTEEAADSASSRSEPDPEAEALERLLAWEQQQRDGTDFSKRPPWSERAGVDPFAVRHMADGTVLGLHRGTGDVVVLDARGVPSTSARTWIDATGWAEYDGQLYVVGPRQGQIDRLVFPEPGAAPVSMGPIVVHGSVSLRTIAIDDAGTMALGDPFAHQLVVASIEAPTPKSIAPQWSAPCGGPLDVRWTSRHLVALCMLDHAVKIWARQPSGLPHGSPTTIEHDGPIWSLDVREQPASLRIALGGVEDHPLDRSDGAFGYVDSFVFVVDVPDGGAPRRRAALNVSEHGVVTPKWLSLQADDRGTSVTTIGYGSDTLLTARWPESFDAPQIESRTLVPGITSVVRTEDGGGLASSTLLDAWVSWDATLSPPRVHALPDERPTLLRVGEALAFTGLIAPAAHSQGKRSRFTCETCHFEGGSDGRVHWTGRAQVHASTRSLRGLFENRPHFSRALDRTMTTMVHNEFRVGSRGTDGSPWFIASAADTPWLRHLGVNDTLDPETLRRALMTFVMAYTHEPNPRALADASAADVDAAGLDRGKALFAEHCETCHSARLLADQPQTRVEPDRWDSMVRNGGAIVWGSADRHRTGIEPNVHEDGPRVPSLRRLFTKRPYFTNGSAASLDEVLQRFSPTRKRHVRAEADDPALSAAQQHALRSWLRRL